MAAVSAATLQAQMRKHIPGGPLIYAIHACWKKDVNGTVTAARPRADACCYAGAMEYVAVFVK